MTNALRELVVGRFEHRFGAAPAFLVRAPGRVNLIGEHTDYNDGFVLPIAIDRAVWVALRPRADGRVRLHSLDYDETLDFGLEDPAAGATGWGVYVVGAARVLQAAGYPLAGWEGVVGGDVPIGAGLSSSAALELAVLRAFAAVGDLPWVPEVMARLGQRVEHEYAGVQCGIMDQMIVAAGRAGAALLIDCRSLDLRTAPLPAATAVVVMDTGTRRGLVDSAYNERRGQCEAAARFFGVPALRDVAPERLEAARDALPEVTRRRARHVVTENARTRAAAEAMAAGDAVRLGHLMDESHESLRRDFEVSSPALDAMVAHARRHAACLGARMTGAGFGGCAVALVEAAAAGAFARHVAQAYHAETGHEGQLYVCTAVDGVQLIAGETVATRA